MRKFIGYYRVSSEEQRKGKLSIPTQQEDCHGWAQRHGVRIVREFIESHSGRWPKARPVYEEALEYLRTHPDVEGIIVFQVNRLARNLTDGSYLLEVLRKSVVCLEYGEICPDDSTGVLTFNILLSVGAHYSAELSRRVRRGMRARAERGHFVGVRPLGYIVDDTVQPHSSKLDPDRAHIIRELFEAVRDQKMTLDQATEWARARGLRTSKGREPARSEIHHILTNPAYYGMVRTKDALYPGRHEPIISKELFDGVQEILNRGDGARTKRENPFKGLLKCGHCGRQFTLTEKLKAGKTYRYLHCYGPRQE